MQTNCLTSASCRIWVNSHLFCKNTQNSRHFTQTANAGVKFSRLLMDYIKYLDQFNKLHEAENIEPLDIGTILENHKIFDEFPRASLDYSLRENGLLKDIIEAQLLSISSLALYLTKNFNTDSKVVRSDFPAKDFQLGSSLIDLANTADCAFKLAMSGFSTQSRILIRSLIERIMQIIVVYFDAEDYRKWCDATEIGDSKFAYYQLFSKKGRLFKRYHQIEKELLGYSENCKLKNHRVNDYAFQSMAVHGGSLAVNVGSWSFNGDQVKPALFGSACDSLNDISCSIAFQLHNFIRLLNALLEQVHLWKQKESHGLISKFEFYRYSSDIEFGKYINENYVAVEET